MTTALGSAAWPPVFRINELLPHRSVHGTRGWAGTPAPAGPPLSKHIAAGRVLRIRRGLYATIPEGADRGSFVVDPFLVASRLAPDAVLAYHAALQFHGRAQTLSNRLTCFTERRVRGFSFQGARYVPVLMPPPARDLAELASGIETGQRQGMAVRVTSLSRTLVDVLDAPRHGGGWDEIWQSLASIDELDLDFVVLYAIRLGCALTAARVGFFLEQHREELDVADRYLDALRRHAPRRPLYLDQHREPGRLVSGWNLIVSERLLNRASS